MIAILSASQDTLSRVIHDHPDPATLQWLRLEVLRESIRQLNLHLRHLPGRTLDLRTEPTGCKTLPRRPTLVLQTDQPDILQIANTPLPPRQPQPRPLSLPLPPPFAPQLTNTPVPSLPFHLAHSPFFPLPRRSCHQALDRLSCGLVMCSFFFYYYYWRVTNVVCCLFISIYLLSLFFFLLCACNCVRVY